MKKTLRNCMSLMLIGALLFSALPAGAFGSVAEDETDRVSTVTGLPGSLMISPVEDETIAVPVPSPISNPQEEWNSRVLYSWTASTLEKDDKAFSSNLISNADKPARWNESGDLYTKYGTQQVVIHSFRNETGGSGDSAYGLPQIEDSAGRTVAENLKVDVYPLTETTGMGAVGLSFVYAYKPSENGLNPANSGLLRIYVSEDGETWSEDYVSVRSVSILGSGTTQDGEEVIYYQIRCEDLMNIDTLSSGDDVQVLRIMPDGENGVAAGSFSLCELTLTGYEEKADFIEAVPDGFAPALDADTRRSAVVAAARSAVAEGKTELEVIQDAISLMTDDIPNSVSELLHNSTRIRPMDGIATQADDSVKALFGYMYEANMMSPEVAAQILAEYEAINTTADIVYDLNTPQTIMRAYGKAKAGDILLQVTDEVSHVYMVVKSEPVYLADRVNVDPMKSTITYLTLEGEKTQTFYDAYMLEDSPPETDNDPIIPDGFLPLTVEMLADDAAQPVRADGHISIADGVRVAVASNWDIESYTLSMGEFSATVPQPGVADIYTSTDLNAAVEALEPGTYTMTVDVTVNGSLEQPDPLVLDFTVSEEVELFDIVGTTMTLGNTLSIDFVIDTAKLTGTDNYAQITKHYADGRADQTVRVDQADWVAFNQTTQPTYYYASFTGIAAKEMCDNVDVVFYNGQDQAVTNVKTDSMQSYAMRMLNKNDVINNTILRTLYVDMLNYGAQAQLAFEYDVSNLANRLLSTEQRGYATAEVTAQNHQVKDGCVYGTSLTLENQILLDVVIDDSKIDSYDGVYAEATYTNHYGDEKTVYVNQVKKFNDYYHYMSVSGMAIADCRQMVTLTLYNSSDEIIGTFTDSVEGYVARTKTEIGDAILKFGQSSYNYFHP